MPVLKITNNVFTNFVTSVDATLFNTNWADITTAVNGIDNANVGTLGFYASQLKPTSGAQATFGSTQLYTFSNGLTVAGGAITAPGGVTTASGFQTTTATNMGVYTGTGAPSFSAPNGSVYLRYDGGSSSLVFYVNSSGASSSGTVWTALAPSAQAAAQQAFANIAYTGTGSESAGSPGVMATATITLGTSPLTNWRVFVTLHADNNTTNSTSSWGIGTTTAGTSPGSMYGASGTTTHLITGQNCVSDIQEGALGLAKTAPPFGYTAIYANGTAPAFKALGGAVIALNDVIQGFIQVIAVAN